MEPGLFINTGAPCKYVVCMYVCPSIQTLLLPAHIAIAIASTCICNVGQHQQPIILIWSRDVYLGTRYKTQYSTGT